MKGGRDGWRQGEWERALISLSALRFPLGEETSFRNDLIIFIISEIHISAHIYIALLKFDLSSF